MKTPKKQFEKLSLRSGTLFMLLLCVLSGGNVLAQQIPLPPAKGFVQSNFLTREKSFMKGNLDSAHDYLGHKYSLDQISINDEIRKAAGDAPALGGEPMPGVAAAKTGPTTHHFVATSLASCSPGYFKLYLEAGCGMDDPGNPADVARLNVMCQVLTDISNFIPSPCTGTGQKVNIWVQNPGGGGGFLGEATPFFSVPYSTTLSGIADNMIWITINSGTDAWTNVTTPLYPSGAYSSFYHGAVAFQFDGSVAWHTDMTTAPLAGEYDLYTVALHEMLHAMGFHTLLNYDATSIFGSGFQYYSRYDQFLQTSSGTPLITHSGSCSLYDWQFNSGLTPFPALSPGWTSGACPTGYQTGPDVDHTVCATANKFSDGSMNIPVYSPACFERGSSLSHFEDECYVPGGFPLSPPASNNQYFVMSNAGEIGPYNPTTNPGAMKRFPVPEERQALCDLGYQVNSTYGSALYLNNETYTGGVCPGLQVAGINDGIAGGAYTYVSIGGAPVIITESSLLSNDYGAAHATCMEVVNGTGTVTPGVGTFTYTPGAGEYGLVLLRYLPVSSGLAVGNITYVYVFVGSAACPPTTCDLVSNGGFESTVPGSYGDMAAAPGIVHCWDVYVASPDLFSRGCGVIGSDIPYIGTLIPTDTHLFSTLPNNHFLDLQGANGNGCTYWCEGMQSQLTSSLISGQNYILSFWAKTGHFSSPFLPFFDNHMEFCISPSAAPLTSIPTGCLTGLPAGLDLIWDATIDTHHGDDWQYYQKPFTYTGAPGNRIVIFNGVYLNSYVPAYAVINYLDDVSIKPASAVITFTLPSTMCISSPLFDLFTAVSVPGGTFSWQTVVSGVVTTSNSNWFDPSLAYNASTMTGGAGLVTVCYNYTDILGCTQNVCATVQLVSGTLPITGSSSSCAGVVTALSDAIPGGTWTSTITTVATVGSATGYVSALTTGTTTISYTTACGTVTMTFTVIAAPVAYVVTGGGSYCGGAGLHIFLSGSDVGIAYQLYCNGSPVGLPVPGTGSPIDFGPQTTIGIYTVVATGSGGSCSATMTGSATITSGAISPITGSSILCVGAYTTLTDAAPGGIWTSSITTVATIGSSTGIAFGAGVGTTTITYTTGGGCYSTFTLTVGSFPLTGNTTICVGQTTTLSDPYAGGVWSSSNTGIATVDGSGDVTGVASGTATITYTTPCGPQTIVVTVIAPAMKCVCDYVAAGYSFTELGASGTITVGSYTGNYFINHNVVISGAVTFLNCVIVMAPGIKVTVASGSKLTVAGSHLFACYPDMWQGIVLSTAIIGGGTGPTGQLELMANIGGITSTIEDAIVAVDITSPIAIAGYSTGGGATTRLTLYSHGATFNENMTGVRIANYAANMPIASTTGLHPSYPFLIENTVFTCRDFTGYSSLSGIFWPFAWPSTFGFPDALKQSITPATPYYPPFYLDIGYAQAVCNNGLLSQYGIDLEKVAFETGPVGGEVYSAAVIGSPSPAGGDAPNLFDNMGYGIYAHNSNLLSRNNGFMNMYPYPATGGDGIDALNDANKKYQLYVFGDFSGTYTNSFWNTVNCVEATEYYDVKGVNAIMNSEHNSGFLADPQGQFGYKISSSDYYELQTNYNFIYNISNGISITTTTPGAGGTQFVGQVTANGNVIAAVNPAGGPVFYGEYVNQAIGIYNLPVAVSSILSGSQENTDENSISGVYNGILVVNSNSLQGQYITAQTNTISIAQNPLLVPGNPNQTGICHMRTLWDYIGSNTVSGPGYNIPAPPSFSGNMYITSPLIEGIHVENTQSNINVDCNTTDNVNTGFYFAGNNPAIHWFDNDMNEDAYGYVLNGIIGQQGSKPSPSGNTWTPGGFWVAPIWETYTLNTTDAANSTLYVSGVDPTVNSGEPPSIEYQWSPLYGIRPAGGPPPACAAPPTSVVPVAMIPGHSDVTSGTPVIGSDGASLAVIPNPNTGTFTLKGTVPAMAASAEATFEVVDMLGRTLYSEVSPISNGVIDKKVIISNNVANGVYFIKVKTDEVSKVLRFTLDR